MNELAKVQSNIVFPVEVLGDTLVVRPAGDSVGYSQTAVQSEMSALVAYAKVTPDPKVVLDLSESNYFGTALLGQLVRLAQTVQSENGRIAVCGASNDMKGVFKMMSLESQWEEFDTFPKAVNAIATIGWAERIKRYERWIILGTIAAMFLIAFALWPRTNYSVIAFDRLLPLWTETQQLIEKNGTETDWVKLTKKAKRVGAEMSDLLRNSVEHDRAAATPLMAIANDLPMIISKRQKESETRIRIIWARFQIAEEKLPAKPQLSVSEVVPANFKLSDADRERAEKELYLPSEESSGEDEPVAPERAAESRPSVVTSPSASSQPVVREETRDRDDD